MAEKKHYKMDIEPATIKKKSTKAFSFPKEKPKKHYSMDCEPGRLGVKGADLNTSRLQPFVVPLEVRDKDGNILAKAEVPSKYWILVDPDQGKLKLDIPEGESIIDFLNRVDRENKNEI